MKSWSYTAIYTLLSFAILIVHAPVAEAATINRPVNNLGLVGYWDFDVGKGGTTAYDMSGNDNDGTLTEMDPATDWIDGKINQALSFDGDNDHVTASGVSLNNWNEQTISLWFKQNSGMVQFARLIEKGANNEWTIVFNYTSGSNKISVQVLGSSSLLLTSTDAFNDDTWHHMVVTIDASQNVNLYIDGVFDVGATSGGSPAKTGTVNIGKFGGASSHYFEGSMDDVRIYNRALSEGEVRRLYNSGQAKYSTFSGTPTAVSDGLVGHWTFDGPVTSTSGTDDVSGNGNNGSFQGGLSPSDSVVGRIGQALDFDGNDDTIDLQRPSELLSLNDFSVSAWINVDSTRGASTDYIVSNYGGSTVTNGDVLFYVTSADLIHATVDGTGLSFATNSTISEDEWVHVVFTVVGNERGDIYLNGSLDASDTTLSGAPAPYFHAPENIMIGSLNDVTNFFQGLIDDVRIYNRALSEGEIQRLYNLGAGSDFNKTHTNRLTDGLVGHWSFDGPVTSTSGTDDVSGNGNNGIFNSSPQRTIGRLGQALNFDGTDDYVDVGDVALAGDFTFTFWVRGDVPGVTGSSIRQPFSKGNAGGNSFSWTHNNSAFSGACAFHDGSNWHSTGNRSFEEDRWYHIVCSYDGATLQLYVDGVADNSLSVATTPGSNSTSLTIGAESAASEFPGDIDDFRLYNRALSVDEISQLYNMGR